MPEFIVCPVCGYNRKLSRSGLYAIERGIPLDKGIKGEARFDIVEDLENIKIIDIRESEGRGTGFRSTGEGYTLKEMIASPQYRHLVEQLYNQVTKLKQYLEDIS